MSGKKKKDKAGKYAAPRSSKQVFVYIATGFGAVCLLLAILLCIGIGSDAKGSTSATTLPTSAPVTTQPTEDTTAPQIQIEIPEEVTMPLGNQLKVTDLGSYTGVFMEDGSDEIVSGIMMLHLTNESDQTLQYAEITLGNAQNEKAYFTVTTLPPGCSAVLLEKNRLPFAKGFEVIAVDNVVFFPEEPSKMEDTLQIRTSDGAINVTNISGQDITGTIQIYYKNSASDVYYGGITYMAKIQDGLKAGETRQLMPSHFNENSSSILFIVIV